MIRPVAHCRPTLARRVRKTPPLPAAAHTHAGAPTQPPSTYAPVSRSSCHLSIHSSGQMDLLEVGCGGVGWGSGDAPVTLDQSTRQGRWTCLGGCGGRCVVSRGGARRRQQRGRHRFSFQPTTPHQPDPCPSSHPAHCTPHNPPTCTRACRACSRRAPCPSPRCTCSTAC